MPNACPKKHKACCKKYKPYILKYKAQILKEVPCIFALYKTLKINILFPAFFIPEIRRKKAQK